MIEFQHAGFSHPRYLCSVRRLASWLWFSKNQRFLKHHLHIHVTPPVDSLALPKEKLSKLCKQIEHLREKTTATATAMAVTTCTTTINNLIRNNKAMFFGASTTSLPASLHGHCVYHSRYGTQTHTTLTALTRRKKDWANERKKASVKEIEAKGVSLSKQKGRSFNKGKRMKWNDAEHETASHSSGADCFSSFKAIFRSSCFSFLVVASKEATTWLFY